MFQGSQKSIWGHLQAPAGLGPKQLAPRETSKAGISYLLTKGLTHRIQKTILFPSILGIVAISGEVHIHIVLILS